MIFACIILGFLLLVALASANHYRGRAEAWENCAKVCCDRYEALVKEREERQGGFRFTYGDQDQKESIQ